VPATRIRALTPTSLATAVQAKSTKIFPIFFEREENLLQNGILNFVFKLSQSSEIVFQSF